MSMDVVKEIVPAMRHIEEIHLIRAIGDRLSAPGYQVTRWSGEVPPVAATHVLGRYPDRRRQDIGTAGTHLQRHFEGGTRICEGPRVRH